MATSQTLQLIIEAENRTKAAIDEAGKGVSGLADKAKALEPAFKKMAMVGTAAFAAITAEVGFAVKAFAEAEASTARANTSLELFGKRSGMTSIEIAKLQKDAEAFGKAQRDLGFDNEDVTETYAGLVNTLGDAQTAQKATTLAMDLARAKGIDLSTAQAAVNMALQGSPKLLKQYGIELEDGATKTEILAALNERLGGTATKMADTMAVKAEVLKNSFGDLQESIGAAFAPVLQKVLDVVVPIIQKFGEWVEQHPKLTAAIVIAAGAIAGIVAVIGTIGLVLPSIIAGLGLLATVIGAIVSPIGLVIIAIGLLVAAIVYIWKHSDQAAKNISVIWTVLKDVWKQIMDSIKGAIGDAADWVYQKSQAIINAARDAISWIGRVTGITAVSNAVKSVSNWVAGRASGGAVSPGTPYVVGETQPELFVPSSYGRIQAAGSGGGINITITGNSFMGREGIAEQIGDEIVRVIQRSVKF